MLSITHDSECPIRRILSQSPNISYKVPAGGQPEHYAALLEAGYTPDRFGLIRGAVIDNDKDTPKNV